MMAPVPFKLEFIYYLGLSLDKEFEIKLDHPHLPRLVIKFGQEMDEKGKDRKKPLCTAITESILHQKLPNNFRTRPHLCRLK